MLLEVDFAGKNADEDPIHGEKTAAERKAMGKARRTVLNNIEAAGAFLTEHETAKIIVTIDTHCLEENGLLVYSDADVTNLEACSLETVGIVRVWCQHWCANANAITQVLRDCIPHTVYQYLSKDPTAPVHAHKSLILNLACGATIGSAESRSGIFNGYV